MFGRIVDITTFTERKYDKYDEVPIFGDLSDEDILNASNLTEVLNVCMFPLRMGVILLHEAHILGQNFVSTWTLAPFASLTNLPKPVSFQHGNDTIYFAETYTSQLSTSGMGFGTFDLVPGSTLDQSGDVWQGDLAGPDKISSGVVQ